MSTRPTAGDPAPFRLPERTDLTLGNGLRATLIEYGAVPKATLRIALRAGGLNERAGASGLAVLASRYLKEGAGDLDAGELAARLARCGGGLDTHSGDDATTLDIAVLSESAPEALRLLGEVVTRPRLPEDELERLRAELLRELAVAATEPSVLALERFHAALYGDHPYAQVLPSREDVEALGIEDVRGFVAGELGAARAHVYVAGRFDLAAVEQALREAFEGWQAGPAPLIAPPSPSSTRAIHLIDRPGAGQSTIRLGLPAPDPSQDDYLPLTVVDTLLGGAFMSRITLNLREDKGYTYSPRSTVAVHYRDAYWMQAADVTTEHTGASLHEIFAEINRLRAEPPSLEELEGVQRFMAGGLLVRNATPAGLLGQLGFLDFHELGASYAEEYVDRVHAVTPERVRELAAEYLRPEEMTIAIAGDASVIREQIAPYGAITT